jgi:hypothetical protein
VKIIIEKLEKVEEFLDPTFKLTFEFCQENLNKLHESLKEETINNFLNIYEILRAEAQMFVLKK